MKELLLDNTLTYKPFGAKAILIEWKPIIDEAILQDILEFKDKIIMIPSNEITELKIKIDKEEKQSLLMN